MLIWLCSWRPKVNASGFLALLSLWRNRMQFSLYLVFDLPGHMIIIISTCRRRKNTPTDFIKINYLTTYLQPTLLHEKNLFAMPKSKSQTSSSADLPYFYAVLKLLRALSWQLTLIWFLFWFNTCRFKWSLLLYCWIILLNDFYSSVRVPTCLGFILDLVA